MCVCVYACVLIFRAQKSIKNSCLFSTHFTCGALQISLRWQCTPTSQPQQQRLFVSLSEGFANDNKNNTATSLCLRIRHFMLITNEHRMPKAKTRRGIVSRKVLLQCCAKAPSPALFPLPAAPHACTWIGGFKYKNSNLLNCSIVVLLVRAAWLTSCFVAFLTLLNAKC